MAKNNAWNSDYPMNVARGGSGVVSNNAYSVLVAGTTSTGNFQNVSGVGSLNQELTSNGSSNLPSWQNSSITTGNMFLLKTQTASSSSSIVFTSFIDTYYTNYVLVISGVVPSTNAYPTLEFSSDNGSTYASSGYASGILSQPYDSTTLTNNNSNSIILLADTSNGVSTGGYYNAYINLYDLASSNLPSHWGWHAYFSGGTATLRIGTLFGSCTSSLTVNAIRIALNTGTITSGQFSLYGISV